MLSSNTTPTTKEKLTGKNSITPIDDAPRLTLNTSQKIQRLDSKEELLSLTQHNVVFVDDYPSISLKRHTTSLPTTQHNNYDFYKSKTEEFTVSPHRESPPISNYNLSGLRKIKDTKYSFSNWFHGLSPMKQILFKITVATLITLAVVSVVALPLYFVVFSPAYSEASFANITASVCASTCIGQEIPYRSSITTTLFTFDGNTNDQTGYVTGVAYGGTGLSYTTGYVTQAVSFGFNGLNYIQVLNLNLAQLSFTIEAWILIPNPAVAIDFGIFAQCDAYNVCMSLSVRNTRLTFSMNSMNTSNMTLTGATLITANVFYHVAIVIDAIKYQQLVYVNGLLDVLSGGMAYPYQGSGTLITTIGRSNSFAYPNSYYYGRIDQFTISAGYVRSACQILNDASLIVYYPFSTTDTYNDYSVNFCNGISSGTTLVSVGRTGQALSFTSNTSYFQSQCFPKTRPYYPAFTVSMWINPTSTTGGGSLMHISLYSNGSGICYDLLGLTTTGAIVTQWIMSLSNVNSTSGPIIPANTWTHIAVVYQSSNGVRLYVNGQLSSASMNTGGFTVYEQSGVPAPWYITLGNISPMGSTLPVNCLTGSAGIAAGAFSGLIDEFRAYNRDLNGEEICVLANP